MRIQLRQFEMNLTKIKSRTMSPTNFFLWANCSILLKLLRFVFAFVVFQRRNVFATCCFSRHFLSFDSTKIALDFFVFRICIQLIPFWKFAIAFSFWIVIAVDVHQFGFIRSRWLETLALKGFVVVWVVISYFIFHVLFIVFSFFPCIISLFSLLTAFARSFIRWFMER